MSKGQNPDKKMIPKDVMRAAGLRATPSRISVFAVLLKSTLPVPVTQIATALGKDAPPETTLYRIVNDFEEAGIIRQIDLRQSKAFYEVIRSDHHHIVCTGCGAVEDIPSCDLHDRIKKIVRGSKKFMTPRDHTFEIFALCKKCA